MKKTLLLSCLALTLMLLNVSVSASDKDDANGYVNDSLKTLNNFANDPNMNWFRQHIKNAKGILIIPSVLKAGFIFGGSGGNGVLLRHSSSNQWGYSAIDEWSYPAFYTMGSATFGFQAGIEAAEVILLIMTEKGMDALLSSKVQLGTDMSVAAGPVGAGAKVATADVYQFSRSKGVFAGLTFDGSVINPREKFNKAYYGRDVTPLDILVKRNARNAQAYNLRARLAAIN
jgi:SH3 domain-containing YSC84-like protein 1